MSDTEERPEHQVDVEDDIDQEADSDLEDTTFNIGLNKTGEKGSGYHTRNPKSDPYQRQTVTERRGAIDIRCKSREVIHGVFGPESPDEFATLLVYDIRLDGTKRASRIISANINFEFSSSEPGGSAPEVFAIAPQGRFSLMPTTHEVSRTRGQSLNASAGQFGASVGGTLAWEKTISRTASDDTRLIGATFCNNYGKEIGANWVLNENKSTETGVPSFLRVAILLKRADESEFKCKFSLEAKADWKTEISKFFGSTPADDPILFDPELPPTNKLRKSGYDLDNLGSIDVSEFSDVTFHTTIGNVIKSDA